MRRNAFLLTLDIALLLCVLGLVLTGLLLAFVLPPGSGRLGVWQMTRHDWGDVHFWISMTLLAGIVLHVAMNWGWVCTIVCRMASARHPAPARMRRNLAGLAFVAVLAVLVTGFLWLARSSRTDLGPAGDAGGRQRQHLRQSAGATSQPLAGDFDAPRRRHR